jgi:hypothetical protein
MTAGAGRETLRFAMHLLLYPNQRFANLDNFKIPKSVLRVQSVPLFH